MSLIVSATKEASASAQVGSGRVASGPAVTPCGSATSLPPPRDTLLNPYDVIVMEDIESGNDLFQSVLDAGVKIMYLHRATLCVMCSVSLNLYYAHHVYTTVVSVILSLCPQPTEYCSSMLAHNNSTIPVSGLQFTLCHHDLFPSLPWRCLKFRGDHCQ